MSVDQEHSIAQGLELLAGADHQFLPASEADAIAGLFGCKARCHTEVDSRFQPKGLTLPRGEPMCGVSAHGLAMSLCDQLGLEYRAFHGRGSQLRECLAVIARHFHVQLSA